MQKTIERPFRLKGRTLWSGEETQLRFMPAEPDSGIRLARLDLKEPREFQPSLDKARVQNHRVILSANGCQLSFVEHLLAGFWGMGIDNVRVEIRGGELPFFDGSALAYVEGIQDAGVLTHDAPRTRIMPSCSLLYVDSSSALYIAPSSRLRISYVFAHRGLKVRRFLDVERDFASLIAPARTFAAGPFPEFPYPFGVKRSGRLAFPYPPRFPDEMVRHKVLDLVGDLALIGVRCPVNIWAYHSGHQSTHQALKLFLKEVAREKPGH